MGADAPPSIEREPHREHDPAAGRALEDARAVGEAARVRLELGDLAARAVEDAHGGDRVADLLAVRADVLDRRRPDGARDAREALHAGQALGDARRDEGVPRLAGLHVEHDAAAVAGLARDPGGEDADDRAGEAVVGDDDVAAAGQHEQGLAGRVGLADRRDEFLLGGGLHEPPRRAAEAQGREVRQPHG